MATANIDLQKFCLNDDSDPRPYLRVPFTQGEFTYATNGHIIVRVPKVDAIGPIDMKNTLDAERCFVGLPEVSQFVPLGKLKLPTLDGPETIQCDACDGRGTVHDCPDCDCECDSCGGSGKEIREKRVSTQIAQALHNSRRD